MSIIDRQNQLGVAVALSGTGALAFPDSIDLTQNRDIGDGEELFAVFTIPTSAAGGADVTFEVISGTGVDGNGVINAGQRVVSRSPVIPLAQLVAGARFLVPIAPGPDLGQRFLSVRIQRTGTFTGGAVSAQILLDNESTAGKYHPRGDTIQN